jgi:predicted MPP superfamily phosphohydrolase
MSKALYYTVRVAETSRRQFVRTALAVGTGAAVGGLVHGYGWERHQLALTRVDLPVAGLPDALDGVRVAFLTDLHLSSLVPASDVANAVAVANAERADFVVLGGDYVSFAERRYMEPVAELLAPLTAPHGVFAILGNHDDDRYMPAALRRRRIDVLADDRTTLTIRGERLELAGLKFWTKGLDDIASVLEGAAAPLILAAHDPRRIVEAAELRVGGVLAGHTHGGQIVLPLVGAVAARKFPIAAGRMTRRTTEMFVSRGIGTVVVPIRINCAPEVAIVTLRRPSPAARL